MKLPVMALAWLLAIAAVALWRLPFWAPVAATLPVAGLFFARRDHARTAVALVCVGLALLGAGRFVAWRDAPPGDIARYVGQPVSLEGTVVSEPDPGETWSSYDVAIHHVRLTDGWTTTDGRVRISVGQYDRYMPGTEVQLTGALEEAPVFTDFDYRGYLARNGVFATMWNPKVALVEVPPRGSLPDAVARLRLALEGGLQRSLPEPEAALGAGIAFGRDGNIPDDLYNDFRDTGLAHVVAVSGANVSMVTALTFLACGWLIGRRWAVVPAGLTVVAYLFVAGLSASVVRAGIMALVYLVGTFLGRQQSALSALGLAAIVMTLVQPQAALDLGFQLSLAATAGLITFGPWIRTGIERYARRGRMAAFVPAAVIQVIALSLSATFATLPISWVNFGRASLVGPLANVVVEPLFVVAFWLSGLTALAGALWPPAGWLLGLAAYYPLAFMTSFTRLVAGFDWAAVDVPDTSGTVELLAFSPLCAVGWRAYRFYAPVVPRSLEHRPLERRVRRVALASGGALAGAAIIPISLLPAGGPGLMELTLLDVAGGDSVLVTTPSGHHVLVNTGPSAVDAARELGAILPHWTRSLDAVFVTQPQEEHAGALSGLLERYEVERVFEPGFETEPAAFVLDGAHVARQSLHAGDRFDVDGVAFQVLWPSPGFSSGNANDDAIVIRVSYRGVRFLLPSNLSAASQKLLQGDAPADALVVPHHGANKTDIAFIESVAPRLALIPIGSGRLAEPPSEEVLASLHDAVTLRTDAGGRITLRTDGSEVTYRRGR